MGRAHRCLLFVVALAFLTPGGSGCTVTDDKPPARTPTLTPAPAVVSREIRSFDFANVEWYDRSVAETVRLVDGSARRGNDRAVSPMDGGGSWKLDGGPLYADADGDGDEDAAVALRTTGDQSHNIGWYVWLWRQGTAVQVRQPIASTNRCARPLDAVTAVAGGFEVRAFVSHSQFTCAEGGAVPVLYVIGVRDGWPVRLRPEFGPIETCDPMDLTARLRPDGPIQLRVHPDDRSPIVEPAGRYDDLLVGEFAPDLEGEWVLAIAERGDVRRCGWVRRDQVGLR